MESSVERMGVPKRLSKCELGTFPDVRIRELLLAKTRSWTPGDCLMLVGDTGRGKTGLAISVIKELISKAVKWDTIKEDTPISVVADSILSLTQMLFINTVDLLPALRSNIEKAETIISELKKVKLLVLDDLGAEKPSDFGIETLYRILNERYNELRSTIITTNHTPGDLKKLFNSAGIGIGITGDRLISRMNGWCELVMLAGPDLRKHE